LAYRALRNALFTLPPEGAHTLAEIALRFARKSPFVLPAIASRCVVYDPALKQTILGLDFQNPVTIAAGFDKNATMIAPLAALGFGAIEVGTITPKPQNGNAKPRLWRHIAQKSMQNAMGFNNDGLKAVVNRLRKLTPFAVPIGVNLGKNKTTPNEKALDDYRVGLEATAEVADYLVFNLSSPNTPALRDLQSETFVGDLFDMARSKTQKPIFLKIAPDLEPSEAIKISIKAVEKGAKGIIAANTTNDYSLIDASAANGGGLSGAVLSEKSRKLFAALSSELFGKTTLISSGGIMDENEAWQRIKLGASLIQVFTGFIYGGYAFAKTINEGIIEKMKAEGFNHIGEAIGSGR
jgi:dihydroorotate dehydrogenase